jgi:hypothetical protein
MHGRPVAGVRVSASWPEPGETLSERPCPPEAQRPDGTRTLSGCFDEALPLVLELASARQGESPVHAETSTAADGTFTLEGLPEGPVDLWALGAQGAAMRPGIPAGSESVELVLEDSGLLEGTVRGDGAPLAGVRVTALSTLRTRFFDATTDADGRYRIGPLPRGLYGLLFAKDGWRPEVLPRDYVERRVEKNQTLQRPRTLTGRVLSPSGSPAPGVPVRVGPGEELPGDGSRTVATDAQGRFTLVLTPERHTLTVSREGQSALARVEPGTQPPPEVVLKLGSALQAHGRVLDDARRPVAGARVKLLPLAYNDGLGEAVTDAEGRYTLGPVEPGTWRFNVEVPGYQDVEDAKHALTAGMGPLDFTLARVPTVEGRLTDASGQPLPRIRLWLARPGTKEDPVDIVMSEGWTDEEGRFVLDAPTPGDYLIEARERRYRHVSLAVRAPSRDVHVTLRPGASVMGALVDSRGLPLEAFSVTLVRRDTDSESRDDVTDARGRFSVQGLEPGAYGLVASRVTDSVQRQVWRELELAEGAQVELEVRLPEEYTLSGLVVDTQGRPPPVAWVRATLPEEDVPEWRQGLSGCGMGAPEGVPTDKDGRFTLRGLTAPQYHLRAQGPGYTFLPERSAGGTPREAEDALLARADAAGVRLVMRREPHLTGRVVGPDGAPLSQLQVNERHQETPGGRFALAFTSKEGAEELVLKARGMATRALIVEPRGGADVDLGEVRLERGRTVRGRVLDARTSQPVSGAVLQLSPSESTSPQDLESLINRTVYARDDGIFEVSALSARAYTLEVTEAPGYRPVSVRVEAQQQEVTLRLEPVSSP